MPRYGLAVTPVSAWLTVPFLLNWGMSPLLPLPSLL